MNTLSDQSVLCPALIGRGDHLDQIQHLIDEVNAGRAHTLLLAGMAGMGKTRLVSEIRKRVETHNWHVLSGLCTQIEQGMPYAPVLEIIRHASESRLPAEPVAELAQRVAELAFLLPQPGMAALPVANSELDRYRVYQSVTRFVAGLCADAPLLLVFEDLHWSDDATLEVLIHLIQRMGPQPVLLVLTYRGDEAGPSLTHFLAEMDRTRRARELRLEPLSRAEVDLMLRAIFGQTKPVRAPFLDGLYTLTEGNPFFIEESLKSMVMAGDLVVTQDGVWTGRPLREYPAPRSIQDTVQQRSERVSDGARALLKLAAVSGRRFDFTLLQRLAGLQEEELLHLLQELIDAQFLEEESADHFVFRHTLTRQCVYASVMGRERRRLHAAIAADLESLYGGQPDAYAAELAYHNHAGERWAQALRYARQAGENALAFWAPRAAVEQFDRAIDAAQWLVDPTLPSLHRQRGQAYALLGEFDAARRDYELALAGARSNQDAQAEWITLLDLGQLWVTQDYAQGGAILAEALTLAQHLDLPALIAHSRNAMGNWEMNQGRPVEAVRNHEQALIIFRSMNDDQGIAETLDLLAIANYNCADIRAGTKHYLDALPLWRTLNDPRGLLHTLSGLGLAADFDLEVNTTPVCQHIAWAEEGVAVARDLGWQSGTTLTLICSALAKRHQGQHGAALDLLDEALALAEEIGHKEWVADAQVAIGAVLLDLLALEEAQTILVRALALAREINSMIWVDNASMVLASVHTLQGDIAQAAATLDAVLKPDTPTALLQNRGLWFARAELALAASRPEEAIEIVRGIQAAARGVDTTDNRPAVVPRLGLLHAQALQALGRDAEAAGLVDACIPAAAEQQRSRLLWRLHALDARLCLKRRDYAAAGQAHAAASQIIDAMTSDVTAASTPDAHDLAEQFSLRARASLPEMPPSARAGRATTSGDGLTPREREVAALVAQGCSNRAIAEALVVSERTAERHVANIMNKLGCDSRTQVATWFVTRDSARIPLGAQDSA